MGGMEGYLNLHPHIETAVQNASSNYSETGDIPDLGSTQVHLLAQEMLKIIKNDLDEIKHKFPAPELIK